MAVPSQVNQYAPNYYELTKAGKVFTASTAVGGLAFPISTSLTIAFGIWNPLGSGVNVVPLRYDVSYCSGTGTVGAFGFMYLSPAGAAAATGSPITAATPITATVSNGFVGSSYRSTGQAQVISAGTLTAVGVAFRGMGVGEGAPTPATAAVWGPFNFDFGGSMILAPGTLVYTAAFGAAASQALFHQSITWAEVAQ